MFNQIYHNIIEEGRKRKLKYKRKSGLHKHHIIPRHSGGNDDEENFSYLTEREHYIVHYLLWKINHNVNDLWSAQFLRKKFYIPKEIRKSQASKGGKIGGKKQAELGLGFHQYKNNKELHRKWSSLGGKSHKGKKCMYKPGDTTFIRVKPKDINYHLENGYIFGSPIVSPNKGIKRNKPSPRRRKVSDGINTYDSVADAALKSNVSSGAIVQRCKSKKSNWHYIS
jgi:hypothetical protein